MNILDILLLTVCLVLVFVLGIVIYDSTLAPECKVNITIEKNYRDQIITSDGCILNIPIIINHDLSIYLSNFNPGDSVNLTVRNGLLADTISGCDGYTPIKTKHCALCNI